MEDHACHQQHHLRGIGDLDESFGERNHQVETRGDVRYGFTRNFAMKEDIKARENTIMNSIDVKDKISQIQGKRKRQPSSQFQRKKQEQKKLQWRGKKKDYKQGKRY